MNSVLLFIIISVNISLLCVIVHLTVYVMGNTVVIVTVIVIIDISMMVIVMNKIIMMMMMMMINVTVNLNHSILFFSILSYPSHPVLIHTISHCPIPPYYVLSVTLIDTVIDTTSLLMFL